MTTDPEKLVGTVLAGRYEVTGVLGAGGMGVVLEACQIAVDRKVAVKLLHPGFGANRQAVARFVREMQVTSRIEHPSTVRVYDFGETSDAEGAHLFLVMELIHGRTLGKVLAAGPLSHPRMIAIAGQIARALEAAHSEGIVHRDLKPDNVMLVDRYGQADVVKVLDFGIARFFDGAEGDGVGTLTAEGAVVGTPTYMSPEQATGAPIGPACDIYSLGVMLFEMATGVVPFSAPTTVSLMVKHVQEAPPRPTDLAPMPARLEEIILACLAKAPEDRPASARALADTLDALGREVASGLDAGGPARVARADSARFELQKERSLAADTARTGSAASAPQWSAGEAETARRSEEDADLPPRKVPKASVSPSAALAKAFGRMAKPGLKSWWIAGVVAVIAAVAAVVAFGGKGAERNVAMEPATPIVTARGDNADPAVTSVLGVRKEGDAWNAGPQAEPLAPAECAVAAVAAVSKARVAVKVRAGDALALANDALRGCQQWAVAQVVLGQAEQANKSWTAARVAFRRAHELAPQWGLPLFDLALVEVAAGAPEPALAALVQLLALAPEWPNARLLKAQVELARGDFTSARSDAEAATIATPERAEAWFLLAESHRALADKGSEATAKASYCKAKALGMQAAAARCDAPGLKVDPDLAPDR